MINKLKENKIDFQIILDKVSDEKVITLLSGLKASIEFERKKLSLERYVDIINEVVNPTTKYSPCEGCGGKMAKLHNDFQVYIWTNLLKIDEKYIPQIPKFESYQYQSKYWADKIRILPFADLRLNSKTCLNDASRMANIKNKMLEISYTKDVENFNKYLSDKLGYFENFLTTFENIKKDVEIVEEVVEIKEPVKTKKSKEVDEQEFIKMLEDGKSLKECSEILGVSTRVLTNYKKKLNI